MIQSTGTQMLMHSAFLLHLQVYLFGACVTSWKQASAAQFASGWTRAVCMQLCSLVHRVEQSMAMALKLQSTYSACWVCLTLLSSSPLPVASQLCCWAIFPVHSTARLLCVFPTLQASGDEVLYVRPDAVFDKSKPISGGIPHCFPQVRAATACSQSPRRMHPSSEHCSV